MKQIKEHTFELSSMGHQCLHTMEVPKGSKYLTSSIYKGQFRAHYIIEDVYDGIMERHEYMALIGHSDYDDHRHDGWELACLDQRDIDTLFIFRRELE